MASMIQLEHLLIFIRYKKVSLIIDASFLDRAGAELKSWFSRFSGWLVDEECL